MLEKWSRYISLFLSSVAIITLFTGFGGWKENVELRIEAVEDHSKDKTVHPSLIDKESHFYTRREAEITLIRIQEDLQEIKQELKKH